MRIHLLGEVVVYLVDTGLEREEACTKACEEMEPETKTDLMNRYKALMKINRLLERSMIHMEIIKAVEVCMARGASFEDALKLSIERLNHLFDGITSREEDDSMDEDLE